MAPAAQGAGVQPNRGVRGVLRRFGGVPATQRRGMPASPNAQVILARALSPAK